MKKVGRMRQTPTITAGPHVNLGMGDGFVVEAPPHGATTGWSLVGSHINIKFIDVSTSTQVAQE